MEQFDDVTSTLESEIVEDTQKNSNSKPSFNV